MNVTSYVALISIFRYGGGDLTTIGVGYLITLSSTNCFGVISPRPVPLCVVTSLTFFYFVPCCLVHLFGCGVLSCDNMTYMYLKIVEHQVLGF